MADHFAFPFRWTTAGRAATVDQDSDREIEQGVRVLLLSHVGERVEVPEFGITDQTFSGRIDEAAISQVASEWDERVELSLRESFDGTNAMIRDLLVQISEREE